MTREHHGDGHPTDLLSAYLDGDLAVERAAEVEAHVAGCPDCAGLLGEIREVVALAGSLDDPQPAADLWPGIASRLKPRTGRPAGTGQPGTGRLAGTGVAPEARSLSPLRRRITLTVPQLAAAMLAAVTLSMGVAWMALPRSAGDTGASVVATIPDGVSGSGAVTLVSYEASYQEAVRDLEQVFSRQRDQLDPATIQVVERNLAIIDAAITEARQALADDPSSGYLNGYLADTMQRKVDLLRQVTRIDQVET